VVAKAHARGIPVIGRFDFSKTRKEVYDAHPEWFFRQANGEPVVYHGLHSVCISGGYYREQAMKILTEALVRYEVDGLFFNMFGNQSTDYSGRFAGHCHCDSCKRKFREMFGRDLPAKPGAGYERFMFTSSRAVAGAIGKLIHSKRPAAGYFNCIQEYTDGIMSESNTAVRRPLPLWPYSASDDVNRARTFVDFPWRFATLPQGEIALRHWQNLANGGARTILRRPIEPGACAGVGPAARRRPRRFANRLSRRIPPAQRTAHTVCRGRLPGVDGETNL
jgi:hypothetical protein